MNVIQSTYPARQEPIAATPIIYHKELYQKDLSTFFAALLTRDGSPAPAPVSTAGPWFSASLYRMSVIGKIGRLYKNY